MLERGCVRHNTGYRIDSPELLRIVDLCLKQEMFIQYLAEQGHNVVKSERKPRRNIQYRDLCTLNPASTFPHSNIPQQAQSLISIISSSSLMSSQRLFHTKKSRRRKPLLDPEKSMARALWSKVRQPSMARNRMSTEQMGLDMPDRLKHPDL
jgi:hypothetical protein